MKKIIVKIKDLILERDSHITVQTMCNVDTNNIESALQQCRKFAKKGSELIRLTTQGLTEVKSLGIIIEKLHEEGINCPIIADVHFSTKVAIAAAEVADKVRINPGNFAPTHEKALREFKKFIIVCKKNNTAVRIGINHGSLGERITQKYGNTAKGMKEAMIEWVNMCIEEDFYNIVLSLKASNTLVMTEAYTLLEEWMEEKGIIFPLHLGVTEAGNGDEGRIKSAVGLSCFLSKGIGETIRISLTEDPVNEVIFGKYIADFYNNHKYKFIEIEKGSVPHFSFDSINKDQFLCEASCTLGPLLMKRTITDFTLNAKINGIEITDDEKKLFKSQILQAARLKFDKCEYIACPGCGRTKYDLQTAFNEVKRRTSHLKGYVIAVMGCIVNGPGEMADADYGYVGETKNLVSIYRKKKPVFRHVPQEVAIDKLLKLIEDDEKASKS
ncbi:MAG: (E)-4-hydroxy-3-methylbut-2-enyl-diphosphate synthase [Bacteroidales bacterium]